MTEKEKMKAGLWYDANNDQELIDQRLICQDLCFALNQLKPSDEKRNEEIVKALNLMNAELKIISGLHTTGSDDFAVYANEIPASYFMIGAKENSNTIYAHHNPKVCFNEQVLPIAAAVYACAALVWK